MFHAFTLSGLLFEFCTSLLFLNHAFFFSFFNNRRSDFFLTNRGCVFLFYNWLFEFLFLPWLLSSFYSLLLVHLVDEGLDSIMNDFLMFFMNYWLMNLFHTRIADDRLHVFVNQVLVFLMNYVLTVFMNHILVVLVDDLLVGILENWLQLVVLHDRGRLVSLDNCLSSILFKDWLLLMYNDFFFRWASCWLLSHHTLGSEQWNLSFLQVTAVLSLYILLFALSTEEVSLEVFSDGHNRHLSLNQVSAIASLLVISVALSAENSALEVDREPLRFISACNNLLLLWGTRLTNESLVCWKMLIC